jgi:hypothetical protein
MKKFVGIFNVSSFHKEGTDQKGIGSEVEETVTTILKPNGYVRGDVFDQVTLHTTDSQSPDWGDRFIVTVEKLEGIPENKGSAIEDFFNQKMEEKRNEGTVKPLVSGRKFR